jgi:hypothetical protein
LFVSKSELTPETDDMIVGIAIVLEFSQGFVSPDGVNLEILEAFQPGSDSLRLLAFFGQ